MNRVALGLTALVLATSACASQPQPTSPDPSLGSAPRGSAAAGTPDVGPSSSEGLSPETSSALPFGEGMTRPQRIAGVHPAYTREAIEAGIEGRLLVKCVIRSTGDLQNCHVIQSLRFLDEAVLRVVRTWRFTPVMYKGKPVSVEYVIPFNFRLPPPPPPKAAP